MRLCRTVYAIALGVTVLVSPRPLVAGVVPPPWDPTSPMQTIQAWDFSTQMPTPFDPFIVNNPNGTPSYLPSGPAAYLPDNPITPNVTGTGVWCLGEGASIEFFIPNFNQQFRKEIFVSIKYSVPGEGVGVPTVDIVGLSGTTGAPCGDTYTPSTVYPGVSMIHYLQCLPTCESFFASVSFPVGVPGSVGYIEQVVIQTRCIVPAPPAAALLAVSMLGLRRRRTS